MYRKITIKVGSNVLTDSNGMPNEERIAGIVGQIARLKKEKGIDVMLVSSGAVASGREVIHPAKKSDSVSNRQLWASVGQVRLISLYARLFASHNLICSQVLATKEDFRDRRHFLNMRNCLNTLLENHVVPIINENDVVSVNELMFTDNDELSGLITDMMNSDALFILSNINGLYDGDPSEKESRVIRRVDGLTQGVSKMISTRKSQFGRGGMLTKYSMARKIAASGTPVHLANGLTPDIILRLIERPDEVEHTYFVASRKKSSVKKWLAHSESGAKGAIYVNEGACRSLFGPKATSLLPVGVTRIVGEFLKGDVVAIIDHEALQVGVGKAEYNSDSARKKIGEKNARPMVHYDYLSLIYSPDTAKYQSDNM
ncbi:MAG: glutamate 5-kinase [Bacteroidales bacterium]